MRVHRGAVRLLQPRRRRLRPRRPQLLPEPAAPRRRRSRGGAGSMIDLAPLGDRAYLARFAAEADAARWAEAIRGRCPTGVVDVVVAYRTAAVHADPERVDLEELGAILRTIDPPALNRPTGREI